MKRTAAGEFKARCLSIMDDVNATGEPVIITKRGEPVAKIVAITSKHRDIFGFMAGQFEVIGDIEPPVLPLRAWEVLRK